MSWVFVIDNLNINIFDIVYNNIVKRQSSQKQDSILVYEKKIPYLVIKGTNKIKQEKYRLRECNFVDLNIQEQLIINSYIINNLI